MIRTTVRVLFEMMDVSPDLSGHERQAVIERARELIADIRRAQGTIQNPEIWQEIHSLANALQVKLDRI